MSDDFTQDFWTSLRKVGDGDTRVGQINRLWYDPKTNTIRRHNGQPGGLIVSGGSTGVQGIQGTQGIRGDDGLGTQGLQGATGPAGTVVYDGGTPTTDFSVGVNINCGGVT